MNSRISLIKCESYDPLLIQGKLKEALDLLGGITAFIKPQTKVLLKPNLLMAKAPEFGITTHPEMVRGVIKLLKTISCRIYCGDGPCVWGSDGEISDEVYEETGIKKVCSEESVELVKLNKRRWRSKFPLATLLDDCDYVVNIPKFKTHTLTILTAAIKNLFGLVSGTYKTELHKDYFHPHDFAKIIVDIYQEVNPALTLVDGVISMEGDGPGTSGKLRRSNLLMASGDAVALDSALALIMGLNPLDVLTTKEAAQRGLGEADPKDIIILGEKLEQFRDASFILPKTSLINKRLPVAVVEIAKKLIKYHPCVERDNCSRCAVCIKACPKRAVSFKNKNIAFDYSKCISCFCCQEACPNSAIKIKKSPLAKFMGL